jgi:hypothetical protein
MTKTDETDGFGGGRFLGGFVVIEAVAVMISAAEGFVDPWFFIMVASPVVGIAVVAAAMHGLRSLLLFLWMHQRDWVEIERDIDVEDERGIQGRLFRGALVVGGLQ